MGARQRRLAVVGGMACAALALGGASVFAATPSTPYGVDEVNAPNLQNNGRVPERLTAARDVDGDGAPDVYASSYTFEDQGVEGAGIVYLFSGRTRNLIRTLHAPDPQAGIDRPRGDPQGDNNPSRFGFYISVPGDVNGDSVEDISVGAPGVDVDGNQDQGRAYVFDGRTGRLIHTIDNPDPQPNAGFGGRIGAAGDVTRDGLADIIASAPSQDLGDRTNAGKAWVFSGSNAQVVSEYVTPEEDLDCVEAGVHVPGTTCGNLGYSPQGIGDLNGDGVTDHMVAASFLNEVGRIYVFSGADESVLTRIDPPEGGQSVAFGLQDTERFTPGDVTGDGVPDVYGSGFQADKNNLRSAGRAWVFDGAASVRTGRGVVVYELPDPQPAEGKAFGFTVSRTDYNKDATPDLYVSSLTNHEDFDPTLPQESYVFDGRDGSPLKLLKMPEEDQQPTEPGDTGSGFGWSSRAPGDLNGDGEPDYVAAAPFQNIGGAKDAGRTYFFVSQVQPPTPPNPPVPPTPPVPPPPVGECVVPGVAGYQFPAKMRLSRARVLREERRLDVLAPITSRAEGDVKVTFHADDRINTFDGDVTQTNGALDVIRVNKRVTRGQAQLGTGIVNITYLGDPDTRAQFIRLRAASQRAELDVEKISLIGDRFSARGSVTSRARGIVRFRYSYLDERGDEKVYAERARIQDDGDWSLSNDEVPTQLARCGGYLSVQFTGYFPRRIGGEQLGYELNAGQTRTP